MSEQFVVGLVQEHYTPDREANVAKSIAGIRKAASAGAQIVCLSELFTSPYFCTTESTALFDLAETFPGPTVTGMQKIAKELQAVLIVPFFERRAAGVYQNSAAVIDADGEILGVYRKMHIPDDPLYYEKYYFTPGDAEGEFGGFKVFKTRYATVGVLICWDQWYPEAARITSLMGADVLFYPTAIGWHPKEKASFGTAQVEAWQTIQRSHAIANGVYVVSANRWGHEPTPGTDGIEFFGHSFIADPFGRFLAEGPDNSSAVLTAKCSREQLEDTRRNWPFFRDRRIDAYKPILNRSLVK